MRSAISAEWTKLLPHRGTWMLVWLYPIGMLLLLLAALAARLGGAPGGPIDAADWIGETAMVWYVPAVGFGRYLVAAYVALAFAGEYGWNTWKLIVPHQARWKLIAAKYAAVLGLLYCAWGAAAAIALVLQVVKSAMLGQAIPAGVTAGALFDGHFSLLVEGIAPLLLTAAYASLTAVLTRSTLAAFILSLVLITVDQLFGKIVVLLSAYGVEWPSALYRLLPGYHLENFGRWLHEGVGLQIRLADGVIAYSQTSSFLMLAAWIVGLAGLVFAVFRRQDLN
ncbi:hypothetical protein [Sphingomonas sp. M1-B02]|uniref:hypothetical protein n=1 Tax=Sphingomonas sp. M1-B02 TaxID=3114300 RepID=UPI00223F9D2F|nr:hypothetical protein [Sphingomonas sp. S6-11]UZK66413.1 ABC transporter permease [Sphingomonas sp. S6-11]